MNLSIAQISAQLERVLASDPAATAVAIRAATRQSAWPESLSLRGRTFALKWCESPLALREALCAAEQQAESSGGVVVLTPLADRALADDVAARLARGRIYQPEGWDIVRQLFQAKETDARLGRYAWMPQVLIDGAARGPYPPVANGFLDLETAWREVLERFLGLASARPDGAALLQWSMQPGADVALNLLPPVMRGDLLQWLASSGGSVGELVLTCLESGRLVDALPLGLVCGVLHAPAGEGMAVLGEAAIRLERYVNGRHLGIAEGRVWAREAEFVVRSAGSSAIRPFLQRAEAVLAELRIAEHAHLSDWLPAALEQRLRELAVALSVQAEQPTLAHLDEVERLTERALQHAAAKVQAQRLERVQMARRLARWLMRPAALAADFGAAVTWQADEGAFVDWARFRLLGGDELPELSQAFGSLRRAVMTRRNAFAEAFGRLLQQWNARVAVPNGRLMPLEAVIDRVLAPLADAHPVLLLVMDGLSTSIYRELFAQVANLGWTEMVPAEAGQAMVGVAALPTVTQVSRASLLSGRLTLGVAAQEKSAFTSHAALLQHSRPGMVPRLFHKGDLADAASLAPDVRTALADSQQRVVGVVYNAVDDHLSGPEQMQQRWVLDELRLLLPLLREAREARRVVVITADHGHLLEDGTQAVRGGDSDRWRPGRDAQAPHELAFKGGRVLVPDGSDVLVCLWGEGTRYAGRKNGYHGGVSPQEVTVPLGVLAPYGLTIPGWQAALPAEPDWWELQHVAPEPVAVDVKRAMPRASRKEDAAAAMGQAQLFEPVAGPVAAPQLLQPAQRHDWVGALLVSPMYLSQRQLAARVALHDNKMRVLLQSLAERGGKLSRSALAQRLAEPEMRLNGMLSAARRVLNVDQAAVLTVDEAAGTIELNRALLIRQFGLETQGVQGRQP